MARRALFGLATLFVASFYVTFLFLKPGGTSSTSAARQPVDPTGQRTARQAAFGSSPMPVADGTAFGQVAAPAESPPDFDAARRDATSAADTADRVRALQVLAEAPAAVSLDILLGATTNGIDPSERATAIISLRQLAQRDQMDARIRNAFLAAASDPDPMVNMLSQSALEGLETPR